MWIKTRLVLYLLLPSIGFSAAFEINFLGVTLLNELKANSTPPTPPYPGLRVEFSSPEPPPDSVVISWMENPPYVTFDEEPLEKSENITRLASSQPGEAMNATNDSSGINQESKQENKDEDGNPTGFRVTGIFQEIVSKGLQICLPVTKINFMKKAGNLQQLDKIIVKKEADLALPVQGSGDGSYGGHTYVEVLKSPGVVFIVDKQQTLKHLRKRVLQAMKDTWPVIILTLLLAGFAGILIWGLVSVHNFDN